MGCMRAEVSVRSELAFIVQGGRGGRSHPKPTHGSHRCESCDPSLMMPAAKKCQVTIYSRLSIMSRAPMPFWRN